MMATNNYSRVNTLELKDLIYRRIGRERAEKYFDQLKRFLSLKLSKVEFDKSCKTIVGRENIPLHNKLIRAIVQNACQVRDKGPQHKSQRVEGLSNKVGSGYQRSCLQSLYGDSFPQSPRKCRSPSNRDRKIQDRPSPLGPLGKSPSLTCEETLTRLQEQSHASELHSLCSKPIREDGEEVEQLRGRNNFQRWNHINPPIGVSIEDKQRGSSKSHKYNLAYKDASETCQSSRELPDTASLTNRLKRKLVSEGLGISMDCAEMLNKGLDAYLKRLIEPCINIAGSRSTDQCNNVRQPNNPMISAANHPSQPKSANIRDFSVAIESNPSVLGVDWPVKLEKIRHYAMDE